MLNFSASEENYIKSIYHLQTEGAVNTNTLAGYLNTKPASITGMMKKLQKKKLVHYQPYYGFRLTTEGNKLALLIVRRHRLWEFFLAEKLKFNWDEVHAIAEELEHVGSKKLIDKLDEYLGFPRYDPHGDPIPDAGGKIDKTKRIRLTEMKPNTKGIVSHVSDQSNELLSLLGHLKIKIGTRIEVKKKFDFDQSLEIKTKGQPSQQVSAELAENIYVEKDE